MEAKLAKMDEGARHVAPSTVELVLHLADLLDGKGREADADTLTALDAATGGKGK